MTRQQQRSPLATTLWLILALATVASAAPPPSGATTTTIAVKRLHHRRWRGGKLRRRSAQGQGLRQSPRHREGHSLGGPCDSIRFPGGWNEAGVVVYPDTVLANALGYGPWEIDMVSYVKRFAGANAVIPQFFTMTDTSRRSTLGYM